MNKKTYLFINVLFYLALITTCLAGLFSPSAEITYLEKDHQPGFSAGDQELFRSLKWDPQTYIEKPGFIAALITGLVLSSVGFALAMAQWEKDRKQTPSNQNLGGNNEQRG